MSDAEGGTERKSVAAASLTAMLGRTPETLFLNCATGLGNILLFVPAYEALRERLPGARITIAYDRRWYGNPFFRNLFGGDVREVRIARPRESAVGLARDLLKARRGRYDVALGPYCGTSIRVAVLLLSTGAKHVVYPRTGRAWVDRRVAVSPDFPEGMHYRDRNLVQARICSGDRATELADGWLRERLGLGARPVDGRIAVHAGGNLGFNAARAWPASHFAALVSTLYRRLGVGAALFGHGDAERAINDQIQAGAGQAVTARLEDQDLAHVATALGSCVVFVGNDSGLMHLANALGVPTVAIHGPTDPRHTGPTGPRSFVCRSGLPCSPCFDFGLSELCPHRRCLQDLAPEVVAGLVERAVRGETAGGDHHSQRSATE